MSAALDFYNNCMLQSQGDLAAESNCLQLTQQQYPNFDPNAEPGFWADPMNILNFIGGAGTAAGSWFNAFGGQQPNPNPSFNNNFNTMQQRRPAIPIWVWIILAIAIIVIIVLLVIAFK